MAGRGFHLSTSHLILIIFKGFHSSTFQITDVFGMKHIESNQHIPLNVLTLSQKVDEFKPAYHKNGAYIEPRSGRV